jgi:polysaccharide biosynthesis transport protein
MNKTLPEPLPFGRRGPSAGADSANTIEIGVLFAGLHRNKWLILLCTLVVAGLSVVATAMMRPTYHAYAEVLLETRQERITGVEQVVSELTVNNSVVAGEIAVLSSNILIGQVVDKLNLIEHPEYNPFESYQTGLVRQVVDIGRDRIDAWRGLEPRPLTAESGSLSQEDARNLVIWQVQRNLRVAQSGIAYVISVSLSSGDPDISAAVVSGITQQYIADQVTAKHAATQRAIIWLDDRLQQLETQLRAAEDAVVEFLEQSLELGGNEDSVAQQLAELNRSFVLARAERDATANRLAHLRVSLEAGDLDAAASALASPRLAALTEERAALDRQRAQIGMRLGPRHPDLMLIDAAITDLERDQEAAIADGLREVEAQLLMAEGRTEALDQNIDAGHRRLVELSRERVRLRQLERSASAMRQVYESFLARFQETTQQLEFNRPDARIITSAEAPLAPSRPRKRLILVLGVIIGAMLGVAFSLIREVTNRTVRNSADLARVAQLPVLGALPDLRRRGKSAAWQTGELRRAQLSPYAEGLRLLRASLLNTRSRVRPRVVMFTGAQPRVGTSTAALGLARVVDALGTSVVVVEANLRRPVLHTLLAIEGTLGPGIVELADGTATVEEALRCDPESGAMAVPAWEPRQNAADLVSSVGFSNALKTLGERFDLVILDAAPALGVADAQVLASLSDATVVVAKAGASREAGIVSAVAAIEGAGGFVVGTLLSHAPRPSGWIMSGRHAVAELEMARP